MKVGAPAPRAVAWCRLARWLRGIVAAERARPSPASGSALSSCRRGSSPVLHHEDLLGEMAHLAGGLAVRLSLDHGEAPCSALRIDDALVEGGREHGQVLELRQRSRGLAPDGRIRDLAIDDERAFEIFPQLPGFPDQLDRLG